jgi:hypothetical protein
LISEGEVGEGEPVSAGELDFEAVRRLLPQRFPLLLVDRVLEHEPGKRLRAYKNVSGNDLHFLGHFPERAILPERSCSSPWPRPASSCSSSPLASSGPASRRSAR